MIGTWHVKCPSRKYVQPFTEWWWIYFTGLCQSESGNVNTTKCFFLWHLHASRLLSFKSDVRKIRCSHEKAISYHTEKVNWPLPLKCVDTLLW